MKEHRIRLTDDDLALIVASLAARRAMSRAVRRERIDALVERLSECARGNPAFRRVLQHERDESLMDGVGVMPAKAPATR